MGISTLIRSRGTLREHLVHPKDKIEKLDINGVVYYHGCAGADGNPCPDDYVGESGRSATARNAEHFSTAQSAPGMFKSAIMQHAADAQHHFRTEDVKIIAREDDYFKRGIKEAMAIRALSPSLNRNEGRHTLPHCWDSLIKAAIKKPEPPATHDPAEPRLSTQKRAPGRPRTNHRSQDDETLAKTVQPPAIAQLAQPTHRMTTRSRAASQGDRGLT